MAGAALVSAILSTISSEAGTLIRGEFKLICGSRDALERLRTTLSLLEAYLDDAEQKQLTENSVKIWLRNLKDVAYDAQDIIDDAATEALRRKVEAKCTSWPGGSSTSCSTSIPFLFQYLIARKIKHVREKLDSILREGNALGLHQSVSFPSQLLEIVAATARPPRETSSIISESHIVGRKDETKNLVEMLLSANDLPATSSNHCPFSVISVVGMGGLGKTTLAQLVYNDRRVQMHFDTKIWLYVSAKFNVARVIREIIESVTKQKSEGTTLDTLQTKLGRELIGKRFLLVLDDVWNESRMEWGDLCAPLHNGKFGSKVLITTRNQSAADAAAPMAPISLNTLSDDECWSILENSVFDDHGSANDHPRLEMMGRQIAMKAKGIPLAATVLGGLLKSVGLDENRWRNILDADLSQLREGDRGIMSVLRLSYDHLPPLLKQCFAYCAVFPKGDSLDKERVVGMWMALGFIHSQGNERMEDIGNDYFNVLCSRSFFQFSEFRYSMHDLMHDLAQAVSGNECFIIEDPDLTKVPNEVRHLTLHKVEHEMLKKLNKFQKLRSLIISTYQPSFIRVLEKSLKKLNKLRVLHFDSSSDLDCDCRCCCCCLGLCGALCCKNPPCDPIEEPKLPSSVGSLKHLRYLHIDVDDIEELPESLCTLYNLQTLIVANCDKFQRFPKRTCNLVNLRLLKANAGIVSNIAYIGNLTSLQELENFCIGREKGHKIDELSNLNQIRGKLTISKLDNVISREEPLKAKLEDKHYIDTLELEWSEDRDTSSIDSGLDEGVLAGLKPHANLKMLIIKNYGGVRSAGWIQDQLPPFLEIVRLLNCAKLEDLPPLGGLRFLKELEATGMAGIKRLGTFKGFPSLEKLSFDNMPILEEWPGAEEGQLFPRLQTLQICSCPRLRGLPPLPLSLRELKIDQVGLYVLPGIQGCPVKPETSSTSSSPPSIVPSATAPPLLPVARALASSSSQTMSSSSLGASLRPYLEDKILQNMGGFVKIMEELDLSALGLPLAPTSSLLLSTSVSSLSKLEISRCPNLLSVSEGLLQQDLMALSTLRIINCEGLVELPENGLPTAIQLLIIKGCPLLKERCLLRGGPDWKKISHIPYIQIDGEWIKGAELGIAISKVYEKLKERFEEFAAGFFSSESNRQNPEGSTSTA